MVPEKTRELENQFFKPFLFTQLCFDLVLQFGKLKKPAKKVRIQSKMTLKKVSENYSDFWHILSKYS